MEEQIKQNANESSTETQLQQIVASGAAETAQIKPIQVEYAGFWVRFAAVLIDGFVLFIPNIIIQTIFGKSIGGFLAYVLMWTYAIYMLNTKQATLGKMAVGLKVTTADGSKPTIGKLALREILGKILNAFTLGIGYIMVAFTKKKQGLHDMIADTVVTYDPNRKKRPWLVVLGIIFALIIPTIGILAGIILVSTNTARNKAQDAATKASIASIMPEALIYYDANGTYTGFKPSVDFKPIECSGEPIINISADGKNMAIFAKNCSDDKKYFCNDSQNSKITETSSDYAKSGAISCVP